MSRGPWAVRSERIKNAGWLTLIGTTLLGRIGNLEPAASGRVSVIETANGVIVRAGDKPVLGDVNRQEDISPYLEAYRLVRPLHIGIEPLFAPFRLEGDQDEVAATQRWLFRYAPKADS